MSHSPAPSTYEATPLVDHLGDITAHRDRDLSDATLVAVLRDLLDTDLAAIYRSVGDVNDPRWLTRARLARGDSTPTADPPWTPLGALPRLATLAAHHQALERQSPVAQPGAGGAPDMLVLPLQTDRELIGVLELQGSRVLSPESRRLISGILRIHRNFQTLLDDNERDQLTGLFNRKTFDEVFYKLAAHTLAGVGDDLPEAAGDNERRAAPPQLHEYLGVIDIDHFKQVNDRHGHLIGDEVLLLLSRLMRSSFRFDDHLYRFGGEEFVVLMRCRSDADAGQAFERLRLAVRDFPFPQVGQLTVSVGFTQVVVGDSPNVAFSRADKAVYWAKSHGRDQVCSHASLVAQGALEAERSAGDVELF